MHEADPRCPNCRAPFRGVQPGATHRCVFCKQSFVHSLPSAALPAGNVALRPTQTAGSSVGVAVALGGLLMAGGVVGWMNSRRPPPKANVDDTMGTAGVTLPAGPTSHPSPIRPLAPIEVLPAPAPAAELGEIVEGATINGGRFYLVDYTNVGQVPITSPGVVASGFDSSNHRVLEQPGFALRHKLASGERTVILLLIAEPPASLARVEITPQTPQRARSCRVRSRRCVRSAGSTGCRCARCQRVCALNLTPVVPQRRPLRRRYRRACIHLFEVDAE